MKNKYVFIAIIFTILMSSCAKVYYSPDAEKISRKHKIIAVAKPRVTMPPQKNKSNEDMLLLNESESESFQYEMVSWLLKRKMEGKIPVDILDATTTVVKIDNATDNSRKLTPKETADILEVDGVITSIYKLTKPMSTGAAIVTSVLFGFGNTNEITVSMELHDRETGKMIWNFNHKLSGGLFSSSDQLVNEVMRIASKKLPYTKFKK